MKPQAPCKDCDERYLGCHDRCEKYKEFSDKVLEWNKQLNSIKYTEAYFEGKSRENANRYREARLKRK